VEILASHAAEEGTGDTTFADAAAVIAEQIGMRRTARKLLQLLDLVRKPQGHI